MNKKHKALRFFINLGIIVVIIFTVGFSGYFAIDKFVVPKYFGSYGISNMNDLVAIVKTLYTQPDEKTFITNPYTRKNTMDAVSKLKNSGFPVLATDDTKLDYAKIASGKDLTIDKTKFPMEFTDKELAGIVDQMLSSGILSSSLPDLAYLDTINMQCREVIISPLVENGVLNKNECSLSLVIKLDTDSVRTQMASYMDVPIFLLNMIVPETIYISSLLNISIDSNGDWKYTGGKISINNRTSTQSEILLNLLISFIFPPEDNMDSYKLLNTFGNIIESGLKYIGNIEFTNNIKVDENTISNGVIITSVPKPIVP
ncbi:MAG: hypothetical protein RR334_01730 [Clostridia bacterium]